ncbi:PSD1 and planctomycete cytochrome C domain-containing protein [Tundrisphaera sp. TA3]|uniref:PSD1 and planctomycete cytochrome C domain-containing protein n=1 Tax=Tundrisphaera sp. TA3 TaxID=3435775 RepID=UPI003EB95FA9
MTRPCWYRPSVFLAIAAAMVSITPPAGAGDRLEFNRDIRPILSENCFLCHGPDKAHREADLRLDDRDAAIALDAIVPGKPEESTLVERILSEEKTEMMPPPSSAKSLTAAQKDTLRRWIAQGAEYQPHWAYVAPRRPEIPAVSRPEWVRNPIDAFILAGLDAKKVAPSPEADRPTLIRRLSLDLIGLPPTPEEVARFEADADPKAYENLVDRLLASPHYGERMAVPWLDLARFTDTVGYHGDQNQNIYPFRDYVIGAFNRNLPFDRFTAEQLAGDLLPDATPEQRVASGFNRLNMVTREGGAQPKEYLAKYAADRVRTTSITWLGSTMGCAECHDHKYDPITAKDFYRFSAFFSDLKQWGVYSDYNYSPNPDLKGFTNDHPFPPELEVESPYLQRRIAADDRRIAELLDLASAKLDQDPAKLSAFQAWRDEVRAFLDRNPTGWATPAASTDEEDVAAREDGSLLFTGKPAKPAAKKAAKGDDGAAITLAGSPGWVAAIRLELLPADEHKGKIVRGGGMGTTIQLSAAVQGGDKKPTKLAIGHADADLRDERYVNGSAVLGVAGLWRTNSQHAREPQTAVYRLARPVRIGDGEQLVVTLKSDAVGRVRISTSPFLPQDPQDDAIDPALLAAARSDEPADLARIRAAYLVGTAADEPTLAAIKTIEIDKFECRGGKTMTLVSEALPEPAVTRVLARGNFLDETGEVVTPAVPHFLPQPPEAESRRLTRLDLARWITSPDNPLTARVFANRMWKQFFGTGLSAVMEDVGAQGEWPSHPDLLDWLALEFRDLWDIKKLVKTIVMSATYRQDARLRPELREVDPSNRWLASQNPRRLEAEFVRDNALSIAGLLNAEMGGPSVFPYQPDGYYAAIQFPNRTYEASQDARQYRRGLYAHWQRTFLQPMLANFDAPSREDCVASRIMANSPQQALTLLNDPTFVEAARTLAAALLRETADSDAARIDRLFLKALARPAKPKERESLQAFLAARRAECQSTPDDAAKLLRVGIAPTPEDLPVAELAAWAEVCRVVLNLHETITRY